MCCQRHILWHNALEPHPPLLDLGDHGWKYAEGSSILIPTIVLVDIPMAPGELFKGDKMWV